MQGGTQIRQRKSGSYSVLLKAKKKVEDLGIEFSTTKMNLSTSQEDFNIEDITVFADREIDTVTLNGEPVAFKKAGAYLYFGDKPIEDGNAPVITPTPTATPTPTQSIPNHASGGGGGRTSGIPTPTAEVPVPTPNGTAQPQQGSKYFSDVTSQSSWAAEAIDYLYEKGIVSGIAQGIFAPEQSVKREEIVKMIALSKNLTSNAAGDLPFTDIPENHWARPYIAAAYEAGVVQGISETAFGLEQNVSRQDLAVLCDRALSMEKEPAGTDTAFADETQIAPYALESVKRLQSIGVINSGGTFRPAGFCHTGRVR